MQRKFLKNTGPTLPGFEMYGHAESTTSPTLTSLPEDFLANPTVALENGKRAKTNAISGQSSIGLFASLDQLGLWVKTFWDFLAQRMVVSSAPFSGTWPKQGMMFAGRCYRLPSLEHRIPENALLLWPTTLASDGKPEEPQPSHHGMLTIPGPITQAMWPTPLASP